MTTPLEGTTPATEDGLREALRTLIEVNETTCFQLRRWGHEQSADYLADQIAVARAALARSTPATPACPPRTPVTAPMRDDELTIWALRHEMRGWRLWALFGPLTAFLIGYAAGR